MQSDDTVAELRALLPEGRVTTSPDALQANRFDEARLTEAGTPIAVVFPRSTAEVQTIVRLAAKHEMPLVPRGAGSGLSGGANASDGCIVVSLTAMNQILSLDQTNQLAVVQPGVITADINRTALPAGLRYPPDPSSDEFCTIGGNIATNAGGLCCVKYGVTGDFVLGLEVVLADATVVRIGRRTRKSVAGYDLVHLFVGSEGTLGIVTEATLRLRPVARPPATVVASFSSLDAAGRAIREIVGAETPSILELMDRTTIQAVEAWKPVGLDTDTEALLIMQSDAADQDAEIAAAESRCADAGATMIVRSSDAAEAELLMTARRLAYPALERTGDVLLDDVAVPIGAIPDLLRAVQAAAQGNGVTIGTFGHAGDGNLHPTIVFDRADAGSVEAARRAFDEVVAVAVDLGGTITGEHGVGTLKRPYLAREIGAEGISLHRSIKTAFDPKGILNPGKAF